MIVYSECLVCKSNQLQTLLTATDYTVSQQAFDIVQCKQCAHTFTQRVPEQDAIGPYYAAASYVSHSDTQEGLINKLYHRIRNITLANKKRLVQKTTNKKQGILLDVGCGTGAFINTMKMAQWHVTGLEPDASARAKAASLYGIEPLPSHEIFNLPAQQYDAISMWHVLEHVHQLHEYIEQLKLLLKDDGVLFVAVPNSTSYDAAHYGKHWAAYDVPRHLYHFTPNSMQYLMAQHGLKIKATQPMWFDSFYVSMLSEQYQTGKSNLMKAFFVGLLSNIKTLFNPKRCSSLIYIITKA